MGVKLGSGPLGAPPPPTHHRYLHSGFWGVHLRVVIGKPGDSSPVPDLARGWGRPDPLNAACRATFTLRSPRPARDWPSPVQQALGSATRCRSGKLLCLQSVLRVRPQLSSPPPPQSAFPQQLTLAEVRTHQPPEIIQKPLRFSAPRNPCAQGQSPRPGSKP